MQNFPIAFPTNGLKDCQVELFYKEGGCKQPTKAMVALAQEKLNRMGYTAGPADGIYGNKTRQAIKRYQQTKNNLRNTGKLDDQTLEALSIDTTIGYKKVWIDTLIFDNTTEKLTFNLPDRSDSQICYSIWTKRLFK